MTSFDNKLKGVLDFIKSIYDAMKSLIKLVIELVATLVDMVLNNKAGIEIIILVLPLLPLIGMWLAFASTLQ